MNLSFERVGRWLLLASISAPTSLACGGSAKSSGDHNVGATSSGGDATTGGSGASTVVAGAGRTAGDASTDVQLLPGSWQMTYRVTPLEMPPGIATCSQGQFMLNVSADGLATISFDGFIDSATAQISGGAYQVDALRLPCLDQTAMPSLTLQGIDTDGDGIADQLSANVAGKVPFYFPDGGISSSPAARMDLTGVPDDTAPTLETPSYAIHPLDSLTITASEAIAAAATVTLVGTPNVSLASVPEMSSSGAPLSSLIAWSTDVILPLSGKWSVMGTGQDLSGRALQTAGEVRTWADPGPFAADGFEGPLVVASLGTPTIVTALGSVPAISGAHSLWLDPGVDVTFHLLRTAAENTIHFSARAFGDHALQSFGVVIEAGVVGGYEIVTQSPSVPAGSALDTGDPTWAYASEVQDFSLDLSEPGTDIVLRLRQQQGPCNPFCGSRQAMMVDDLTLE